MGASVVEEFFKRATAPGTVTGARRHQPVIIPVPVLAE